MNLVAQSRRASSDSHSTLSWGVLASFASVSARSARRAPTWSAGSGHWSSTVSWQHRQELAEAPTGGHTPRWLRENCFWGGGGAGAWNGPGAQEPPETPPPPGRGCCGCGPDEPSCWGPEPVFLPATTASRSTCRRMSSERASSLKAGNASGREKAGGWGWVPRASGLPAAGRLLGPGPLGGQGALSAGKGRGGRLSQLAAPGEGRRALCLATQLCQLRISRTRR